MVVPSASFLERQIKAGVFQKLDKSQLPNLKNMDPDIMQPRRRCTTRATSTPSTYMWGTTGIGYNEDKIKKILGDANAPVDSWNLIFDPEIAAKFKDCGISVLDAPDEIVSDRAGLPRQGPEQPEGGGSEARPKTKLMAIRPYIRMIHTSQYIDDLANGEICIAVGWSGDILQARDRADEAARASRSSTRSRRKARSSGSTCWRSRPTRRIRRTRTRSSTTCCDPEVAADNSNFVNYANGNAASLADGRTTKCKNDPGIYPTPEVKAKLFPDRSPTAKIHAPAEPDLDHVPDRASDISAGENERAVRISWPLRLQLADAALLSCALRSGT